VEAGIMSQERQSVTVERKDVTAGVRSVGVVAGDVVMFHSSLSSMGFVAGAADAVIDGFLDAVGPEGTVAAPTLCRYAEEDRAEAPAHWDPGSTPCYVGRIPETLWRRPGAVRSDHFTHSVAAIGARAAELTAGHGAGGLRLSPWGPSAFAAESPWARFHGWNAAYCFLGVTFSVNTMVHYVESLVVERALARAEPRARERLAAQVTDWLKPGVWPRIAIEDREAIEAKLAREGVVRYGRIGNATLRCARARPMVDRWLAIVEADPRRWFAPDFVRWLEF